MTAKNFVNFHVLMSHSPSCLNRDDMNLQKTAQFGGVTRVRISSQSLKRAMRKSAYYEAQWGATSVRTRQLGRLQQALIQALGDRFSPELISQALTWISGKEGITEATEADAVAPWSVAEVAYFCEQIQAGKRDGMDVKKLQKVIEKDAQPFRTAMSQALDIALSGRMATSGLMTHLPMDGALAVAHVLTTHAVEPQDVDWFTAVDDLVQDAGEVGAGHLNTQQFSAGVFYRYASLNLKLLQVNLGLLATMHSPETAESRQKALVMAGHVLHLLATVVPTAKQQSFAAHNPADGVLVSLGDQPISLANAFEKPVPRDRQGGYLEPSMQRLTEYWGRVNAFYGLEEQAVAAAVQPVVTPASMTWLPNLPAVEQWLVQDGRG
ncbi:MAG: system Cascade subunit CasC [Pseudomonadota bacterium]|nr:system Cascade subunit CasC [Pseudomonadota bacterium]